MVVEFIVFFVMLVGFVLFSTSRGWLTSLRERRRARFLDAKMQELSGKAVSVALEQFGPPFEDFTGSTGRSLYVWRSPPSDNFPQGPGLLIVTLTAENGLISHTDWKTRGNA
jgi:hypothetical protein